MAGAMVDHEAGQAASYGACEVAPARAPMPRPAGRRVGTALALVACGALALVGPRRFKGGTAL